MTYTLVPFTQQHIEPALTLFRKGYAAEQVHSPLLPSRALDDPAWLTEGLQAFVANPGVAVMHQNQLVAYMLTGFQFPFKGQNAVLVPEYAHGAVIADKAQLYQTMYLHLAAQWAKNQRHLHLIGHFAHDAVLQQTLYQLGYGAILAERLRDFSPIPEVSTAGIVEEQEVDKLLPIELEHRAYYPDSPIFIFESTDNDEALADLHAHQQQGRVFFVYYENEQPCAYMIVGASASEGEGALLRHTQTAQVKGAYARPKVRGKGIGKMLLQRAIMWAQQQGYARLFVEHETANFYGGRFWRTHFSPYLYFSMRYIDNRIGQKADDSI